MVSVGMDGIAGILIHHFVGGIVRAMTMDVETVLSVERVSSGVMTIPMDMKISEAMMMPELEKRITVLLEMTPKGPMRCFTSRFYSEKWHGPIIAGHVYCQEGIEV